MVLGKELFFDERLVVPDATLKISDGALAPWRKGKSPYFLQTIEAIAKHYEFDQNTKWKDLPAYVQQVFLHGSGEEEIPFRYDEGGRVYQVTRVFEGVIPNMERRYRETDSNWIREEFERYQNNRPCGTCEGFRLRQEALAVKIADLHVGHVVQMSIREAYEWCTTVPASLTCATKRDCKGDFERNSGTFGFPKQCGPRVFDIVSCQRNVERGRKSEN